LFCAFLPVQPGIAQDQSAGAAASTPTIKAEARQVLVDTVVTDKKGKYIRDLTAKNFKVFEDGKEQPINSFFLQDDSTNPDNAPVHYLVLFFDNSTMDIGDQAKARAAAAKFIDANANPKHLMAIANFGGMLQITQNFTADPTRLRAVVANLQNSFVSPSPDTAQVASLGGLPGAPNLQQAAADFGVRGVMQAIRNLAKGLSTVPGRKTLVMLSSGFPMTPQVESELAATIDACNKTNVAIYPIDVRGLVVDAPGLDMSKPGISQQQNESFGGAKLVYASLHSTELDPVPMVGAAFLDPFQHGGAPVGGGGSHGGGPVGGGGSHGPAPAPAPVPTRGGAGGGSPTNPGFYGPNPAGSRASQPSLIIPPPQPTAMDNQQVLYGLADGTGGFVIVNTNDLLGGLQKIANDQSQYYILGYAPPDSKEGSCHTLHVKVDRSGTNVRARSGYCNVKPQDLLAGNAVEKNLEVRATGEMPGNVTASMQAPFYYTAPNTARVNLALDIPSIAVKFDKVKGKQHASVNILGIATKPDGSIAARFSDTMNFDFEDKKDIDTFQKQPLHYQNQFEIGSGEYKLRVVFSSASESFGKLEVPLKISSYDPKEFSISGIALSDDIRMVSEISSGVESDLMQDKTPLVSGGRQFAPSATNQFKKSDNAGIYVEVYEPTLASGKKATIQLYFKIVDRNAGKPKIQVALNNIEAMGKQGNPVVPVGLKLPVETLDPGAYRLELKAVDSAGNATQLAGTDFQVEAAQ
jgi:VWFA-related protein